MWNFKGPEMRPPESLMDKIKTINSIINQKAQFQKYIFTDFCILYGENPFFTDLFYSFESTLHVDR